MMDLAGNRWQVWERHVRGKVTGITWDEFKVQVVEKNPIIEEDSWVFKAERTYLLPRNVNRPLRTALTNTDADGALAFTGATSGEYELLIQAQHFRDVRLRLVLEAHTELALTLETVAPVLPPVVPPDIIQASGGEFRLNGRPLRFAGASIRGLVQYGDPKILDGASRESDRDQQAVQ